MPLTTVSPCHLVTLSSVSRKSVSRKRACPVGLLNWIKLPFLRRPRDPLGRRGEKRAAHYARHTLGLRLLARNVLCPCGELDLIALDGNDLVFIEVRTRAAETFTTPEATIRADKKRFLLRSARWFIRTRRLQNFHPRFDVIAIVWPAGADPEIRHHRAVFGFSARGTRRGGRGG